MTPRRWTKFRTLTVGRATSPDAGAPDPLYLWERAGVRGANSSALADILLMIPGLPTPAHERSLVPAHPERDDVRPRARTLRHCPPGRHHRARVRLRIAAAPLGLQGQERRHLFDQLDPLRRIREDAGRRGSDGAR